MCVSFYSLGFNCHKNNMLSFVYGSAVVFSVDEFSIQFEAHQIGEFMSSTYCVTCLQKVNTFLIQSGIHKMSEFMSSKYSVVCLQNVCTFAYNV